MDPSADSTILKLVIAIKSKWIFQQVGETENFGKNYASGETFRKKRNYYS